MPKSSSTCEAGDIVIAELRFSDGEELKRRPLLVIGVREDMLDVVVLKITSIEHASPFWVPLEAQDIEGEHLKKKSWIVADYIATIGTITITRKAGKIKARKMAEVKAKLRAFLKL